jgi:hypothetical protein
MTMQNSFIDWIVEHTLAGWISRTCGKYSALIAVILGGIGATLVGASQAAGVPHQYALPMQGIGGIFVAIAGLMGHQNSANSAQSQNLGLSKAVQVLLIAILLTGACRAQTAGQVVAALTPPVADPVNLYGVGMSYNPSGSPMVAGSALYAHQIAAPVSDAAPGITGTYAFTELDLLPASKNPFTVTTNVGVGIAQKVATIAGVPIFMPTAAGVTVTGVNTGWNWSGGGMAAIRVKGNYFILPSLRFLKSSVGGSGYQLISGIDFGWGK